MRVELITVGDELLLGFVIDTNAAHLARELAAVGVEIVRRATVPDEAAPIAGAVREALERTGAVITTGGLGPTSDDLTKPAIAALFGREMRLDEQILAGIEERFRRYGYRGAMPPGNRQQALIPDGARVLQNNHGTAPGIWLEDERGRWVAMLPGVPREMRGMLADTLLPILRERVGADPPVVLSRTLRTTGIGESALAELLGEYGRGFPGLRLAFNPKWAGTDLRLTSAGRPLAEARRVLDEAAAKLYDRAGRHIYGEDDADLAAVVLGIACARWLTIAVAESCTGGLLGARLTAIAGSSDVMLGGVIAYHNDVKVRTLGVRPETLAEHGAVSEPVAAQMAAAARAVTASDIGVAITGIAGPEGGTPEKPVGLVWIAVQIGETTRTHGRVYVGDREEIRLRASQAALDLIRRMLQDGARGG
jgi:nicotinamide-nucleotide amidase